MGIPYDLIIAFVRVYPKETLSHMYKNFYLTVIHNS